MKVTIVQNGQLSIILTPETEIESIALHQMAKGEVLFQVHEKLQIIDKVLPNAAVICSKLTKENEL